jgi:hypothetical protein
LIIGKLVNVDKLLWSHAFFQYSESPVIDAGQGIIRGYTAHKNATVFREIVVGTSREAHAHSRHVRHPSPAPSGFCLVDKI